MFRKTKALLNTQWAGKYENATSNCIEYCFGRLKEIDLNTLLSLHCPNRSDWWDLRYDFAFDQASPLRMHFVKI